jgi:hypothetical protein
MKGKETQRQKKEARLQGSPFFLSTVRGISDSDVTQNLSNSSAYADKAPLSSSFGLVA